MMASSPQIVSEPPNTTRSGDHGSGISTRCHTTNNPTMLRPTKAMKEIEIMMAFQDGHDGGRYQNRRNQHKLSTACLSLSSRDLLVGESERTGRLELPLQQTVSLKYEYSGKLIQTLLSLDFDDFRSFLEVYPTIANASSGQVMVPKHILGYSTNFKYVHRKIMEFSLLSENGRLREYERWNRLPDWEKEMFSEQANEIMGQRKSLQITSSSRKTRGCNYVLNPPSKMLSTKRASPRREKLKVRSNSDNIHGMSLNQSGTTLHSTRRASALLSPKQHEMSRRKVRRTRNSQVPLPTLPASVWIDHIIPLLGDRQSWNAVTSTCRELHQSCKSISSNTLLPPWPEDTILGRTTNVQSVSFSSNDEFVAFSSFVGGGKNGMNRKGCIQVIDRRVGRTKPILLSSSKSYFCCFSPVGTILACTDRNSIVLWEINSKTKRVPSRIIHRLSLPGSDEAMKKKTPTCLAFSPDGAVLAAAFRDGDDNLNDHDNGPYEIHLWNVSRDEPQVCGRYIMGIQSMLGIASLAFSPDGQTMAGATKNNVSQAAEGAQGAIFVWDVSSVTNDLSNGQRTVIVPMIHSLLHEQAITGISYSKDGRFLASSHASGCIVVWNVADDYDYAGEYVASKSGIIATALAFSPVPNCVTSQDRNQGAPKLVCGKSDGTIKALNLDTNKSTDVRQETRMSKTKKATGDISIQGVTFSSDAQTMLFTTADGLVHMSKFVCKD